MKSNKQREPVSYPVHPAANLFPMMTAEEYEGLKADIAQHKQRKAITVWNGQLIDGRNRLQVCNELGIPPLVEELESNIDPVAWVVSVNLHRRHLSTGQRASIAAKLASQKHGGDRKSATIKSQIQLSISDAAKLLGVSPASIKQAKHLIENASQDLIDAVDNGRLSLNAATKLMNGKSVSDSEKPTTEERDKVTKLMQFLRSELQRCSETELTEATIKARKVLEEMGSPKQKTYEEWKAEFDRQNEPARQAAEQAKEKRDAENAATQAKKRAAIEAKHSAIKRRSDENWAAFDAQRGD